MRGSIRFPMVACGSMVARGSLSAVARQLFRSQWQRLKGADETARSSPKQSQRSAPTEHGSEVLHSVHPLVSYLNPGFFAGRDGIHVRARAESDQRYRFSRSAGKTASIELFRYDQHPVLKGRNASPTSLDWNHAASAIAAKTLHGSPRSEGSLIWALSGIDFASPRQVFRRDELGLALRKFDAGQDPDPITANGHASGSTNRSSLLLHPRLNCLHDDSLRDVIWPRRKQRREDESEHRHHQGDSRRDESGHGGRPRPHDQDTDEHSLNDSDHSGEETHHDRPRNIVIFIRDQVKPEDLWLPRDWAKTHLPNQQWLKDNGLSFANACTNSSMCSAARSTFFTSKFPAQHEVGLVLSDIPNPILDVQPQLNPDLPNLATVLKGQGYDVAFIGKAHLSKTFTRHDGELVYQDLNSYGFDDWQGPDAGQDMEIQNAGGGFADNDGHYTQQAVDWIAGRAASDADKPFCLVVSLINPHDVLSYPLSYKDFGYDDTWLQGDIKELPPTVAEVLQQNYKPSVQTQWNLTQQVAQPLYTDEEKLNYLNFYGNLLIDVDQKMGEILAALGKTEDPAHYSDLLKDTLIVSTSDHGEMGLSHGGLVQKMEVAYDEALKVPMVWSNPDYFYGGQESDALVSHVDFLPTLVNFLGFDPAYIQEQDFRGVDYSKVIRYAHSNQSMAGAPDAQDVLLYTFDDIYAGQDPALSFNGNVEHGLLPAANRIEALRSKDFKLVRYYSGDKPYVPANWEEEFYDLRKNGGDYYPDRDPVTGEPNIFKGNPLELINLAPAADQQRVLNGQSALATPVQLEAYRQMSKLLNEQIAARLNPLPVPAPVEPSVFVYAGGSQSGSVYKQGDPVRRLIDEQTSQSLELAFNTRAHQSYSIVYKNATGGQVILRSDIAGTNGPVYQYISGLPSDVGLSDIGIQWDNGLVPLA